MKLEKKTPIGSAVNTTARRTINHLGLRISSLYLELCKKLQDDALIESLLPAGISFSNNTFQVADIEFPIKCMTTETGLNIWIIACDKRSDLNKRTKFFAEIILFGFGDPISGSFKATTIPHRPITIGDNLLADVLNLLVDDAIISFLDNRSEFLAPLQHFATLDATIEANDDDCEDRDDPEINPEDDNGIPIALYDIDNLKKVIGRTPDPSSSNIRAVQGLIEAGDEAATRTLRIVTPDIIQKFDAFTQHAPHLEKLSQTLRDWLSLSLNTNTQIRMQPLLLLGQPGVGKTWYLERVTQTLELPFRKVPMTGVTLSETFIGASPAWRNSQEGIVAKTLLNEKIANPVMFIDEFDKINAHQYNMDPYRPFYTLFERESASTFLDEFLQFPMNAENILWVMTANSIDHIPETILSRLNVIDVPEISPDQIRKIIISIYAAANRLYDNWFDKTLSPDVITRLGLMTPRNIRMAIEDAFAAAGAKNRKAITVADLPSRQAAKSTSPIGFMSNLS